MPNDFTQLQRACGLSDKEIAQFLEVSSPHIEKWQSGNPEAPDEMIEKLLSLDITLQQAALNGMHSAVDILEESGEVEAIIPIPIYPDDSTFFKYRHKEELPFNSTHLTLCNRVASLLRVEGLQVLFIDYKSYNQIKNNVPQSERYETEF